MRKHYRDKDKFERLLNTLDAAERRSNLRYERAKQAVREHQADLDYYYAAFQSPCRNCPGWIQELQGLQVEGFEKAVNRLLVTG